jgi:hypothetical protein
MPAIPRLEGAHDERIRGAYWAMSSAICEPVWQEGEMDQPEFNAGAGGEVDDGSAAQLLEQIAGALHGDGTMPDGQ